MKLYCVFQNTISTYDYKNKKHLAVESEFQGVFDDRQTAINMCKDEMWWIGVANLNEPLPDESCDWPEYIEPHKEDH